VHVESDRLAEEDEIEVTEEMREAGGLVFLQVCGSLSEDDAAEAIFKAMAQAKHRST